MPSESEVVGSNPDRAHIWVRERYCRIVYLCLGVYLSVFMVTSFYNYEYLKHSGVNHLQIGAFDLSFVILTSLPGQRGPSGFPLNRR